MDPDEITAYLLRRPQWSASRSSGPGGQHRDKAQSQHCYSEAEFEAVFRAHTDPHLFAQWIGPAA